MPLPGDPSLSDTTPAPSESLLGDAATAGLVIIPINLVVFMFASARITSDALWFLVIALAVLQGFAGIGAISSGRTVRVVVGILLVLGAVLGGFAGISMWGLASTKC